MRAKLQLCWDCQNARADRCCWMAKGRPVKGWTAEVVPERNKHVASTTYSITACPHFVKDKKVKKTVTIAQKAKAFGVSVQEYRRIMIRKDRRQGGKGVKIVE